MTEHLIVGTSTLSDAFLRRLLRYSRHLAAGSDADGHAFAAELDAAVRTVLTRRCLEWSEIAEGFPDWDRCVASLPRDGEA